MNFGMDIMSALMENDLQKKQMGPPAPQGYGAPPQMGPPPPADYAPPESQGPQMPEAYTTNRMANAGMPAAAQIGEALFDKYRANKWSKENQVEVDEMGETVGDQPGRDSPQTKDGAKGMGSGIFDGGDLFSQVSKALMFMA